VYFFQVFFQLGSPRCRPRDTLVRNWQRHCHVL